MLQPAMRDPVYFAAVEGDSPLLERLLTEGRSTEVKGLDGCSAIGAAAERGHEEVVRQLLLFRANVQAVDKFGSTPLHAAAEGGTVVLLDCFWPLTPMSTRAAFQACSPYITRRCTTMIMCRRRSFLVAQSSRPCA